MLQIACQVWFWRFRSPHNEIVRERLAKQSVAQAAVTRLNKHRAAVMSEAKSQLGLWSDAGIEESRETFWCDNVILDKVSSTPVTVAHTLCLALMHMRLDSALRLCD